MSDEKAGDNSVSDSGSKGTPRKVAFNPCECQDLRLVFHVLCRKLLALKAITSKDPQIEVCSPVLVSLLDACVKQIAEISKMPHFPEITRELVAQYESPYYRPSKPIAYVGRDSSPVDCLTARESQVARYLGQGKSNKEIAVMLSLSVKTVETYRTRIMCKLDLHSVADLVRFAIRNHLAEI